MKGKLIAIVVIVAGLSGCRTATYNSILSSERFDAAGYHPIPCDRDNCGKRPS